jgi:hypothetical protein
MGKRGEREMKDEYFIYRIIRACGSSTANSDINVFALERIIEDIKAAEREACAKVCEEKALYFQYDFIPPYDVADSCAEAIRARGDMSTKPQNVNTSEERVQETDKSIHDDDDIQEYKKPWVGLTDDDHKDFANRTKLLPILAKTLAEFIEAKLKEKNNG